MVNTLHDDDDDDNNKLGKFEINCRTPNETDCAGR
jgi:hypothetical protein